MRWPPLKSWTSKTKVKGQIYFVAINYGGKGKTRWVDMVSVVDGTLSLRVHWSDISNTSKWVSGWTIIRNFKQEGEELNDTQFEYEPLQSLELSNDSGLTIPMTNGFIREWH